MEDRWRKAERERERERDAAASAKVARREDGWVRGGAKTAFQLDSPRGGLTKPTKMFEARPSKRVTSVILAKGAPQHAPCLKRRGAQERERERERERLPQALGRGSGGVRDGGPKHCFM